MRQFGKYKDSETVLVNIRILKQFVIFVVFLKQFGQYKDFGSVCDFSGIFWVGSIETVWVVVYSLKATELVYR